MKDQEPDWTNPNQVLELHKLHKLSRKMNYIKAEFFNLKK